MISIVTTCHNRRHHLARTLPKMVKYGCGDIIVVCGDEERDTIEWISKSFPLVKTATVAVDNQFRVASARNIGARLAAGPLIAFVDADHEIEQPLIEWVHTLEPDQFFAFTPGSWDLGGFIVCPKQSFEAIDGFDEAFCGWGHEDTDFIERLERYGAQRRDVPQNAVSAIAHGHQERQIGPASGGFSSLIEAYYLGAFYRHVKADVSALNGAPLPLNARNALMTAIKTAARTALERRDSELIITCGVNSLTFNQGQAFTERQLVYRMDFMPILRGLYGEHNLNRSQDAEDFGNQRSRAITTSAA